MSYFNRPNFNRRSVLKSSLALLAGGALGRTAEAAAAEPAIKNVNLNSSPSTLKITELKKANPLSVAASGGALRLARLANYDSSFYELLPRLFPATPNMKDMFARSPELAASTAMRNGSLQGAYFMIAARSLGLDCGPMSGFDNAKVDLEFFGTSAPGTGSAAGAFIAAGPVKSNFLCNLGYGDAAKLHPRGPHLEFDEACQML